MPRLTAQEKLRKVWRAMLCRCNNANDPSYKNYGGRGITVCVEWHEFETFMEDMGIPERGLTLERIENNQGYSRANCRWATRKEQTRNTRSNKYFEFNGEVMCLADWATKFGFCNNFISRRMYVQGMSFAEAITKPKRYKVWRKSRLPANHAGCG